ncbi:MAG: c-type cytochrome [Hydrogenophilaceae bacterium]|jgi:mono/diheme cytochrome c family protein|nr:c-type cytochrome [Hydrogenophilaceae bacterium]
MKAIVFSALVAVAACACAGPDAGTASAPAQADADIIENGRQIAQAECALCHAIGAEGESPRAGAPPLRHVLARYRSDALAEDLNEGIRVGHADMPEFTLPVQGVDMLLAYLQSIQESPDAP